MLELLKLGPTSFSRIYIGKDYYKDILTLMPKTKMSEHQKLELLNLIFNSYYDTALSTDEFACEFYDITDIILNRGYVPLELEYLAIEEIYEEILDILNGETENERI